MTPVDKDPVAVDELDDKRLLESLRAAVEPSPIADDRNEDLIEAVLSRPFPCSQAHEPTRDVLNLLDGLDESDAELAESLIAAYQPAPLDAKSLDAMIAKAVQRKRSATILRIPRWRTRNQAAAALLLAAAAGIVVAINRFEEPTSEQAAAKPEALAVSRSVAPLFAETFSRATPTERIDRIYAVRSRELRHNRYAAWRVR